MNIRLFKPSLGKEELEEISDSFDKSWVGLGPKVRKFELEWSKFIGCKASLAVNSATAALHLALAAFRFPEGKKVLVPAITFASTAFAPIYNKLIPVFVDVEPDTISISMDDLEKKYNKDCVAVIPVHFGGHPALIDEIIQFAKIKNLKVIEDCAHCAGSLYKGKSLGNWSDFGCFSFEEKKLMTTGDGGMLCSDNIELIEEIKPARWVGIDKDTWKRADGYTDIESKDAMHWYYEINILGYKYNMNDLCASIGLSQLKKLKKFNLRRSSAIVKYLEGIKDIEGISPLLPYQSERYNYWLFGIRCGNRDNLIVFLKSKGISTGVHYVPLPLMPFFKKFSKNDTPVALNIWKKFITLPLHSDLTGKEIDYIINNLKEYKKC